MTDRVQASGTVGRRSGAFLLSRLVGSAGFFVAVVVLAQGLEPTGRGAIAFLTVAALTVGAIVRLGLGDATYILATRHHEQRPVLLTNLLLWTVCSATIGGSIVAGGLFLAGDRRPLGIGSAEIVAVALGTVLSSLVEAQYPMLLASGRVRQQATITAAGPWLYAGGIVALWLTGGLTIAGAAFAWVGSQGVWAAALVAVNVRGIGLAKPNIVLLREGVFLGLQVWAGNLAYFLNARLDQLIMGVLASTPSLGAYAVAVNAAEMVLYVPTAAAQAVLSAIASSAPELRVARVTLAYRAALLVTVAVSVVAALLGPVAVPLIFGRRYADAIVPFLLLLPGAIGFTAMIMFSPALLLSSSPKLASLGAAVALVVDVTLDLALIPRFDVVGAAVAASASLLAGGAAALISYRTRVRTSWSGFIPGGADVGLLRSFAQQALRSLRVPPPR